MGPIFQYVLLFEISCTQAHGNSLKFICNLNESILQFILHLHDLIVQ